MSATADSGAFIKAQDLQFATANLEPYLYTLLFKIPCEGKEVGRCISLARALCCVATRQIVRGCVRLQAAT